MSDMESATENNTLRGIAKSIEAVEGWLSFDEGKFLYEAARGASGRGVVVEIGSWQGKSTIWLAKGSMAGKSVPVYAIDPHTGAPEHHVIFGTKDIWTFDRFKENIAKAGVGAIVQPIVGRSGEVGATWGEPVEVLWIDGAHDFAAAEQDFKTWFPHLVEGGLVAYHDATFGEVKDVVRKHILHSRNFKDVGVIDSIIFATKVSPMRQTVSHRLRNRYIALLVEVQDALRRLPVPSSLRPYGKAVARKIFRKT